MKVFVHTHIVQEIEVPDGASKDDVLNFLSQEQSFRQAFVGVSDQNQYYRITDVNVEDEYVVQLGEECFDD